MGDLGSKHDKVLKRVHLWIAVLGGIVTLLIGLYNFKSIFFPDKTPDKPAIQASAPQETKTSPIPAGQTLSLKTFLPMDRNGDGKVGENEWSGSPESFTRLDLDGSGTLTSLDFNASGFEDMDTNGDGSITRFEWRRVRKAFAALDINRDGKISREEFKTRLSPDLS